MNPQPGVTPQIQDRNIVLPAEFMRLCPQPLELGLVLGPVNITEGPALQVQIPVLRQFILGIGNEIMEKRMAESSVLMVEADFPLS